MGLTVLLNVDVDSQNADHLSQDEGQASKVEGPAIGVVALLILITLCAWVTSVGRDVHYHPDDVAEA